MDSSTALDLILSGDAKLFAIVRLLSSSQMLSFGLSKVVSVKPAPIVFDTRRRRGADRGDRE